MIKPNILYLGFDDRKFIWIGIPLVTILIQFLFYGFTPKIIEAFELPELIEGLIYSTAYNLLMSIYLSFVRFRLISPTKIESDSARCFNCS